MDNITKTAISAGIGYIGASILSSQLEPRGWEIQTGGPLDNSGTMGLYPGGGLKDKNQIGGLAPCMGPNCSRDRKRYFAGPIQAPEWINDIFYNPRIAGGVAVVFMLGLGALFIYYMTK